ncbi:TPA: replication/maintenance protein RepL [Bacillus cereus]
MTPLRIIDVTTGEDRTQEYSLVNRKQAEGYKRAIEKEQYRLLSRGKNWVASYHDPIREVITGLTLTEAGAIIKLLPFLRFKSDGKLIKNGKPLKQMDIQRIFKRGKVATTKILTRLEELSVIHVLKEGRSNVYSISANFHTMGDVKNGESFTKLYQVKTQEIVADLDLNEVGLLYKILPFFHFQTYYLCSNPNEQDAKEIKHLNREELAEATGHDLATISVTVNKLRSKGVIMTTNSRNRVRYLVHPDVMYRKDTEDEYTEVVRRMFAEHMTRI